MIPLELRARIRRMHFAEHWPVGTIGRGAGSAPRALAADNVSHVGGSTNQATALAAYRDFIVGALEDHRRYRGGRDIHSDAPARVCRR